MLSNKPQRRNLRISTPSQEKYHRRLILRSIKESFREPHKYAGVGGTFRPDSLILLPLNLIKRPSLDQL